MLLFDAKETRMTSHSLGVDMFACGRPGYGSCYGAFSAFLNTTRLPFPSDRNYHIANTILRNAFSIFTSILQELFNHHSHATPPRTGPYQTTAKYPVVV
jgi:hypothetical protein